MMNSHDGFRCRSVCRGKSGWRRLKSSKKLAIMIEQAAHLTHAPKVFQVSDDVACNVHLRLAENADVQGRGKFADIVAAKVEESEGFGNAEKAHFFQFQVGYGAAAVDAEAARIRVQLVAQDFAVEPRRALGENQAPLGNVHDAATLGMVGRGCNEIDIRCQQRDHVHEFVGVVGAIAVHGADNFIRSVADASKYGRRDAAVDLILYQSTILAGSEQAIEEFPGSVGTAIVDEDEVEVVVLGQEF